MRRGQHPLPELGLLPLLGLEGIEKRLVLAGGIDAPLDTQFFQGIDKTEGRRSHADGAHQTGLIGVDLIRRARDVIGTRGTEIGNHCIDLDRRILGAQAADLVVDVAGLHRTSARTVDPQYHALGVGILESGPQCAHHLVRTRRLLVGDHAPHVDDGGVSIAAGDLVATQLKHRREQCQRAEQIDEGQQLEENPPAPGATLFLNTSKQSLFEQPPAAALFLIFANRRFPLIRHNLQPQRYSRSPASRRSPKTHSQPDAENTPAIFRQVAHHR